MAAAASDQKPGAERADMTAWLAVAAGTLGALMATLDISIVNSSLPTIQGEIGASGTEGTWVATAYLVAEIVIIPLSAWLTRMLGLRTFLLIAVVLVLMGVRKVKKAKAPERTIETTKDTVAYLKHPTRV